MVKNVLKLPTTEQLANEFSRLLAEEIGPEDLNFGVRVLNRLDPRYANTNACASHDFCDANEVMSEAFKNLTGVEPDRTNPALDGKYMPGMSDEVGKLWTEAWALAKKNEFKAVPA